MQKLAVLLFFLFSISLRGNVEEALVLLKSDKEKAIKILEQEFDEEESVQKRAEISYLISLDPSQKTEKSMDYYVKNTLLNHKDLEEKERYRLYRYLAELSFKKGDLKTALKNYELVLARPQFIQGIEDYLTLQKAWVLINLNRYSEASKSLAAYLKTESGKLQDIMSHDLGKFMAESLNIKEIGKGQRDQIRKVAKSLEVKSQEFYAGLMSGLIRGDDKKGKRERFEKFVVNSGNYDAFYAYALLNNKFQKKSPCDFLDWKLPSTVSEEVATLMVKKSFACDKREKDVLRVSQFVSRKGHRGLELALVQEKLGLSTVCETALELLKDDTDKLDQVLKITGKHCHNEKHQKAYLAMWSSLTPAIKDSLVQNSEALYLKTIESYQSDKKGLNENLVALKGKFDSFGPSQKRNLLVMAFEENNLEVAGLWLKENPELLYHVRIFPLAMNKAKELGDVHKDPILVFLRQDISSEAISFKRKDLRRVKGFISKDAYKNLKLYRELAVVKWQAARMKTLKAQDKFFFKSKRIVKQLSNHKWLNEDLKSRFLTTFKGTLKRGTKTLNRHQTEISQTLKGVLEKWEASL